MNKVKKCSPIILVFFMFVSPQTYPKYSFIERICSFVKQRPKIAIAVSATIAYICLAKYIKRSCDNRLVSALHHKHVWRSYILMLMNATVPEQEMPELARKLVIAIRNGKISKAEMYLDAGVEIPAARASNYATEFLTIMNKAFGPDNNQDSFTKATLFARAGASLYDSKNPQLQARVSTLIVTCLNHSHRHFLESKRNNSSDLRCADLLIARNGKIDPNDQDAINLLHTATFDGNRTLVLKLIAAGIRIDAPTQTGDTAMHIAAHQGYTGIVESLLKHRAQIDATNNLGQTPLLKAVMAEKSDTVKFFIKHNADVNIAADHVTPLIYAARHGLIDSATRLLKCPTLEKTIQDAHGRTALENASTDAMRQLLAT